MTTSTDETNLLNAANSGDLTSVTKILKHLAGGEAAQFQPDTLSTVISDIANQGTNNPSLTVSTLQVFMNVAGAYTDPDSTSLAMDTLAQNGNAVGALAIADKLTAAQLTALNGNFDLGNTLIGLANPFLPDGSQINPATVAANVANFMVHDGAYLDPESAGMAMQSLAQSGNAAGALAVADRLTTAQLTALNSDGNFFLGNTLNGLTNPFLPDGSQISPAMMAANIVNFMGHVGAYIDPESAGLAMLMLAQNGNAAGALAIADKLTTAQLTALNTDSTFDLGNTLSGLTNPRLPDGTPIDPATVAANIANFMAHDGAYVDPESAGLAMEMLAQNGNAAGALAIADKLTTAQLTALNTDSTFDLGNTLSGLTNPRLPDGTPIDPATVAANIANFMAHDGAYVDPESAGLAMEMLAQNGYAAGALAIADKLTIAQLTAISGTDHGNFDLGNTLSGLTNPHLPDGTPIDLATLTANIVNFMAHDGAYVDPESAGLAMEMLAQNGYAAGALAIADKLTTAQLTALNTDGNFDLGNTLFGLTNPHLPDGTPIDPATVASNVANFMAHDGAYVDPVSIGNALQTLADAGNLHGVSAVLDNTTASQYNTILSNSPGLLGHLASDGLTLLSNAADTYTGTNGDDIVFGLSGKDVIHGGDGNDFIAGGLGNDTLYGDAGNDTLDGGPGSNILYGGTGADVFVFDSIGKGVDTVKDFSVTEGDKLDLSNLLTGYHPGTDAITDFVHATQDPAGNTIISVDTDGKGTHAGFVNVVTLTNVSGVDINDWLLHGQLVVAHSG